MSENQKLSIELKSISAEEPGTFEGALSTYGNVDLTGEAVQAGAFTKTLKDSGGTVPLFLNHDHEHQVGVLKLHDTPTALAAKGRFNLDLPLARDAYSNLLFNQKHGVKSALSIGFRTIKDRVEGNVRHLLELSLKEGSLTLFPANEQALVNAVKSAENALREQRISALFQEAKRAFQWKPLH
jgi:HK97 family phage prohead protease